MQVTEATECQVSHISLFRNSMDNIISLKIHGGLSSVVLWDELTENRYMHYVVKGKQFS